MSKHDERLLEKEIVHLQGAVARMTQDVIALQQENAELKARNDGLRKALDYANEQLHEALPMHKGEVT